MTRFGHVGIGDKRQDGRKFEAVRLQDAQAPREISVEETDSLIEATDEPRLVSIAVEFDLDGIAIAHEVVGAKQHGGVFLGHGFKCLICTEILIHRSRNPVVDTMCLLLNVPSSPQRKCSRETFSV